MRLVSWILGLSIAFLAGQVQAGEQQEKMKACNAESGKQKLAGEERKAFMSKCLKKDFVIKTETAPNPQHDKMRNCNADAKAKNLSGEERKQFMSACLKTVTQTTGATVATPAQ